MQWKIYIVLQSKAYFDLFVCLFVLKPKYYHTVKLLSLKALDG